MNTTTPLRSYLGPALLVFITAAGSSCSSSSPNNTAATGGTGGTAGATGTVIGGGGSGGTAVGAAGHSGTGGTTGGTGGTLATGGTGGTVALGGGGSGGSGGTAVGGSGGSAGSTGGASGGGGGSANNVVPTCKTEAVADGVDRATNNYIECDYEGQSLDWDVAANYGNLKVGYEPTLPVSVTTYGTAITGYAAQECHPYCFKGNLTVGLDLVPGAETAQRGEILFDFPTALLPMLANAVGRDSLGWIFVDGPALPAGTMLTAQMVLKSTDNGVIVENGSKDVTPGNWIEFKYFAIEQGFPAAMLTNITSIGFRISLTGANAATADWHGVVYADHFQLRHAPP